MICKCRICNKEYEESEMAFFDFGDGCLCNNCWKQENKKELKDEGEKR